MGLAVLGTIAATVTRNDLLSAVPTRAVVMGAITAGYGTAFTIAGVIAVVSVVIAIAAITGGRAGNRIESVPEAA